MITVEATLEKYIYKNTNTGFNIIALSNDLVATGILPDIKVGEKLKLSGEYRNHPKFGKQFKINSYEIIYPTTEYGIKKYLGSGIIKGIGPAIAERIVALFKDNTLNILDNDINQLIKINGIGKAKLESIKIGWEEQKAVKDIMIFLQSYDITSAMALRIYNQYKRDSIKIVSENPYKLTEIWGIGFKFADKVGMNMGFSTDNPLRIRSGIEYVLTEASNEGHTFLLYEELCKRCQKILTIDLTRYDSILKKMNHDGVIVISESRFYLSLFYYSERHVESILSMYNHKISESFIKQFNKVRIDTKFYSSQQIKAIRMAFENNVMILTGGPGTGKTTTLKGIINAYSQLNKEILLAAPTGRAAKRMSEVIGMEAKTIHRLLEFNPSNGQPKKNADDYLKADIIIIDETSMVDIVLMNHLLNAIDENTTIIFVGDANQLPSIGAGNVLYDMIYHGKIPTMNLTTIFRQAEESQIVTNAHRIHRGEWIQIDNKSDFFFIEEKDDTKIPDIIANLCAFRLPSTYSYDPIKDIQIITPMHRSQTGTINLNRTLQSVLNNKEQISVSGQKNFKIGDKVMQLKNNYDKEVFNGDIGVIVNMNIEEQIIIIDFNNKLVNYNISDLDELILAYAITIHKSQGSEYPCIIMPITMAHYIMLQRKLLYTAVTRAAKTMILIGSKQALLMAIKNKQSSSRYSYLFGAN